MQLLGLAASLRAGSSNRKLLRLAAGLARQHGAEVHEVDFREFVCPYYDGDQEQAGGMPEGATRLADWLRRVDGLLLASPEYNYGIPGTLKNTIDWTSRIRPLPFRGKTGFLMGASNGAVGTNRGLWQTRIPFECLGVALYPEMFGLPFATDAFTAEGTLLESSRGDRLERLLGGYLRFARALAQPAAGG